MNYNLATILAVLAIIFVLITYITSAGGADARRRDSKAIHLGPESGVRRGARDDFARAVSRRVLAPAAFGEKDGGGGLRLEG
jgi:hypothetical protein